MPPPRFAARRSRSNALRAVFPVAMLPPAAISPFQAVFAGGAVVVGWGVGAEAGAEARCCPAAEGAGR